MKSYLVIILLAILLAQAYTIQEVYGHATPTQTGTRVTVHADITSITVNWVKPVVDFNDGPDINGELTLQYSILESGHPEQMVTDVIQISDWNYDLYQTYPVNKNTLRKEIPKHTIYSHDTCHDLGEMHIHLMAVEEDKPDLGGFAKDRAKSAARSALAVLAGLTEVTAAARGNVLGAMAAGAYWYLQENESLGSKIETINLENKENIGDKSITTVATEYGSVTVNVRIWTEENADQSCTSVSKKSSVALSKGEKTTKKSENKVAKLDSSKILQIKNELSGLYQISKNSEKLTSTIKKANDDEAKILKKLSGDTKSIYSKSKSPDAKKLGDKIQEQIKDTESDKKQIGAIDAGAKKITKQILAVAKENKITKTELDKPTRDGKKDDSKNKSQENLSQYYTGSFGFGESYGDMEELAKLLFDARTKREQSDNEFDKQMSEKLLKELIELTAKDKLADKNSDPKNEKSETVQKDPESPPESILDDVETDSGPDVRAPKQKPDASQDNRMIDPYSESNQKPKQESGIDHARIAQDDMRIIEESLRQELLDQIRDTQLQIDLERQLKDLKQKIVIDDTKKPVIQKDPIKLPETKTDNKPKPAEVKPKSTQPEKTEKPVIQKDPVITEPKPSNTKPTLSIPKQVTQEATGPSGANVAFSTSSSDKEDGSLTTVCTPVSGSMFPIGATSVSCTVTDSNNNSVSGSFTVTVRDTTPPAFAPFQPTEGVRDDTGVQVFFDVTANDLVDGNVPVSCNYQSGYKFPPGVTELKCTTSDSRGNQSTKTVQITVTVTESGQ